jgi:hypothetical protein
VEFVASSKIAVDKSSVEHSILDNEYPRIRYMLQSQEALKAMPATASCHS